MLGAAGFGYYCNDVFDIAQDDKVGKSNSASGHAGPIRLLILLALGFLAMMPWIAFVREALLTAIALSHLLLFVLYSSPPLRLKERGFSGAVVDALYAHVLPSVIILIAFNPKADWQWMVVVTAVAIWQMALGFRSILTHQLSDFSSDRANAVRTYAVRLGVQRTLHLISSVVPVVEAAALFVFVLSIAILNIKLSLASVVTLGLVMLTKPFGEGVLRYHPDRGHVVSSLFNQIQEAYLPLIFLVALCTVDGGYGWVAALHLILFLPGNAQVLNLGKDHVVKPLYYRGFIDLLYIGIFKRSYYGLVNRSYYHGARPFYFDAIRPVYHTFRAVAVHLGYVVLHVFRKSYYGLVVWPSYNVVWKLMVMLWHLLFRIRHGRWHPASGRPVVSDDSEHDK
jgi:hypothetical protein